MKLTNRIFKGLIALKNKQIKLERERSQGYKETNDILAAYLALLVERHGSAGSSDPLNQRATVGWKATKVTVRLVEAFMIRIETAASV